ncbi:MAG: hypothetical protein ACFCVE_00820 [Phycisphaerae bacterium]
MRRPERSSITAARHTLERLEPRRLLSAEPTALEQYMLFELNRSRTIAGLQPLTMHPALLEAARADAVWGLTAESDRLGPAEVFGGVGQFGRTAEQRATAAGYPAGRGDGSRSMAIDREPILLADGIRRAQQHLGHGYVVVDGVARFQPEMSLARLKMLRPDATHFGGGIVLEQAAFPQGGTTLYGATGTYSIGTHDTGNYITGTVYHSFDGSSGSLSPVQGLPGVAVTAVRLSDGAAFHGTSQTAGGYAINVPDGAYKVFAAGDALDGYLVERDVVLVRGENELVNLDMTELEPHPPFLEISVPAGGVWYIKPSIRLQNRIVITQDADRIYANVNGQMLEAPRADVRQIYIKPDFGPTHIVASVGASLYFLGLYRDDTVFSGWGDDYLRMGGGDDWVNAGGGNDTILGGRGDDYLFGATGRDSIDGGEGNDRIFGGSHDDLLDGGFGDDLIFGGPGNDTLLGSSGNDRLYGGLGDDWLKGGSHNDRLEGGPGADSMFGGPGVDLVDYSTRTNPVSVDIGPEPGGVPAVGTDGEAGEGDFISNDVERVYGGAGDDTLRGGSGQAVFWGWGGNDLFVPRGAATLYGGDGDDVFFANDAAVTWIFGDAGEDQAKLDVLDVISGVEHYMRV